MTLKEQYVELQKYRKIQSSEIINNKKRNVWEFFRSLTNVSNLEKNLSSNFLLYIAPLKQIRGTNMVTWPVGTNIEIYVDEIFSISNHELVEIQLTHEVLHGLSETVDGKQYFFCHEYDGSGDSKYLGINEATTQMFTEDIEQIRLDEKTDYLYTIKNIMRIMKSLFGVKFIADQYLNNANRFEDEFNIAADFKFEPFVALVNDVYKLSKTNFYGSLTPEQLEKLQVKQTNLLNFTANLIHQFSQNNSSIINTICDELKDEKFQERLNLTRQEIIDHKNCK